MTLRRVFLETVGCGQDPSSGMTDSVSAIAKILKGLTTYKSQVEVMFEVIPEVLSIKPEDFYVLLGTDDEKEKDYFSFLLGPSIGVQIGNIEVSKNLGVFVTVPIESLTTCAHAYFDRRKTVDCLKKMDIYEIGIYEAIGTGLTSSVGVSVGVSGGMEFLHGTSNKWGGYGFGISIGAGPKIFIAEAGGEFGLVFSALESGGRVYVDEFIGFNVYLNVGVGPEDPIPVTVSIGCAFAKVSTPDKCKKNAPPMCPSNNLKQMIKKMKDTVVQMGQDWVDLYNTCKSYWGKKWKKCSSTADNYADAYKGCGKGFTKKCASFKSNYCQSGKWKAATSRCKKYLERRGSCKQWNTKKHCTSFGQKRGSCNTWNTRTHCSNYGTKRGSCRTWNTRRYCGQHGQSRSCSWVRKGTSWARIPYPCGVKWCRSGWFRYPCGAHICHKNVAEALMGWSCKMVTNIHSCLRYVVENLSCRTYNYVKDTANCIKHVVENTSCRAYNWVKDTSNCVKHAILKTTCRAYHMVKDTTNCVGGWIRTAGKCMVDTVGHCSKWAGTCTKNQVVSKLNMFKDCGVNMLPFVPA